MPRGGSTKKETIQGLKQLVARSDETAYRKDYYQCFLDQQIEQIEAKADYDADRYWIPILKLVDPVMKDLNDLLGEYWLCIDTYKYFMDNKGYDLTHEQIWGKLNSLCAINRAEKAYKYIDKRRAICFRKKHWEEDN